MSIRILIADDHKIVREGLRMFLTLDPELEIIGEASNGVEAVDKTRLLLPDIVLMDLLMPEMDGLTATALIRKEMPEVEIIALTSVLDNGSVTGAIKAGAIGYLLKDADAKELCRAIHAAAAGQVQLSPKAAEKLLQDVRMPISQEALTERETEVMRLIAMGKSNKEIAVNLRISDTTVKTHVSKILSKLNQASRTQVALYAVQVGLL
jgi:NarL family two-component system response regulator LiaR